MRAHVKTWESKRINRNPWDAMGTQSELWIPCEGIRLNRKTIRNRAQLMNTRRNEWEPLEAVGIFASRMAEFRHRLMRHGSVTE